VQTVVALFAMLWSGVATLIIGLAIKYTLGWRISADEEQEGIDSVEHGETAYDLGVGGGAWGGVGTLVGSAASHSSESKEGAHA
jgi:Amt family ammonium transporter